MTIRSMEAFAGRDGAEREFMGEIPIGLLSVQDLFARYYLDLVRLIRYVVDDQATAEDIVQGVFLALQRRGSAHLEQPKKYLQSAALNGARSVLRRRRLLNTLTLRYEQPAVDDGIARMEAHHDVLAAIRRLPTRQRQVVVLRFYEDLPISEIASILAISGSAVSSSLSRALTSLGRELTGGDSA